jgi:hypothetical protein
LPHQEGVSLARREPPATTRPDPENTSAPSRGRGPRASRRGHASNRGDGSWHSRGSRRTRGRGKVPPRRRRTLSPTRRSITTPPALGESEGYQGCMAYPVLLWPRAESLRLWSHSHSSVGHADRTWVIQVGVRSAVSSVPERTRGELARTNPLRQRVLQMALVWGEWVAQVEVADRAAQEAELERSASGPAESLAERGSCVSDGEEPSDGTDRGAGMQVA